MVDFLRGRALLIFAMTLASCGSESRSESTPTRVHIRLGGWTTEERVLQERDGKREIQRLNQEVLEVPGVLDVTSSLGVGDLHWRLVIDPRSRTVWGTLATICDELAQQRPRIVRDRQWRWTTTDHADISFEIEPSPLVRTLVFEPTRTADVSLAGIARSLTEIPGVRFAHASGSRFERTFVEVDPDRLASLGLTVDDIEGGVRSALARDLAPLDLERFVLHTIEENLVHLADLARSGREFVDSANPLPDHPVGVIQIVHSIYTEWDQILERAVELGTSERLLVRWLHPTDLEREEADAHRVDSFDRTVWIDMGGADDLTLARHAREVSDVLNAMPYVHVWAHSVPEIQPVIDLQLNATGRSLGMTPRQLRFAVPQHGETPIPLDALLVRTPTGEGVPLTEIANVIEAEAVRPLMNVGGHAVVRVLVRLEGQEEREAQLDSIRAAVNALERPAGLRIAVRALASESF